MSPVRYSGQPPFAFAYRLTCTPSRPPRSTMRSGSTAAFAADPRPGAGHIFFGMPGYGLLRISPDLLEQQTIELPRICGR